jgi:hypothetical protein
VKAGVAVVFVASLISLAMFAGREFCKNEQGSLYRAAEASVLLLWLISVGILMAGHVAQGNGTAKQVLATRNGEENNEGATGREERARGVSLVGQIL